MNFISFIIKFIKFKSVIKFISSKGSNVTNVHHRVQFPMSMPQPLSYGLKVDEESVAPVIWRQTSVDGQVPRCFHTQVDWVARVTVSRCNEMWNRVYSKSNPKHHEPSTYPNGSAERRPKVANDQYGRDSYNLVRGRYPSSLSTGKSKPTFYCRNSEAN